MTADDTASVSSQSSAPVTLIVEYEGADEFVEDFRQNISQGGTFVHTDSNLPAGTEVFLVLTFPGLLRPINLSGRVSANNGEQPGGDSGLDIEFLGYDDIARARLESLVEAIIAENPRIVGKVVHCLIVEENPHVAGLIRDGLTQRGPRSFGRPVAFQFTNAIDGQEALEILGSEHVDVAIIELDLAVISGLELIGELKAEPRYQSCGVIAMSSRETGIFEARAAGCTQFVAKPLRLKELVTAMKDVLSSAS